MAFVQCFIGTCVWLLLSEIFPMAIRGFAMGIAVFALWTVNAAISFLFPILVVALGSTGTFTVFVLVNIAVPDLRGEVRAGDKGAVAGRAGGALPHRRHANHRPHVGGGSSAIE